MDLEDGRGVRGAVGVAKRRPELADGSSEVSVGVSSGLRAVGASDAGGALEAMVGASEADAGMFAPVKAAPQDEQNRACGGI